MELSVYPRSTVHEFLSLLVHAKSEGIDTVDDLIAAISPHAEGFKKTQNAPPRTMASRQWEVCPSCGHGALRLCPQSSSLAGVPVLVCSHRCGYSEVAHG